MKEFLKKCWSWIVYFYTGEKKLEVTLFKILGTGGMLVSFFGFFQGLITDLSLSGTLANLVAAVLSLILMWFVHTTKKYIFGYLLTTFLIFSGLFMALFFSMGGLEGSMPYFFSFAIVFTGLMYNGWLLCFIEIYQILFYLIVCYISVIRPETVIPFQNAESQFIDQMVGIIFSAVCIGLIFLFYIRQYRKQRKLAEDSSNAKSTLLANMSHEIRTPINMLLGMNEMVLREAENSQIKEYARSVDESGRQLLFMINQLLDFSRLDMGKDSLIEQSFEIYKLVDGLGAYFGKEAEKKGLEFVMNEDREVAPVVIGDMRKLSQILTNLLSNAVKYTHKGTIVFVVSNKGVEDGCQKIGFEVADTGIGIAKDALDKIFNSFERADILKNRNIEGTGLGLAISKKLSELMGAELHVESEYGKGTVFSFELMLKIGKKTDSVNDEDENVTSFLAPNARLLVVDDNNMNLLVVKSLLKRTLINIDLAMNAEECYEKIKKNSYDMILMDYMMPVTDGIEAMKTIRKMEGEKHTPISILTADASPEKKQMFLESGFDDYLLKPIDWVELEKTLIRHLPEKLVTKITKENIRELTEEQAECFEKLLEPYDISFSSGMKYMSGDINQYALIAQIFTDNSETNRERLLSSMKNEDYDDVTLQVHSLKGNMRNAGAENVYYGCRRLEMRCRNRDIDYIRVTIPVLLFEWERVEKGLRLFLDEYEKIKPGLIQNNLEKAEVVLSDNELLGRLLEALTLGNQKPALKLTDELISRGKHEKLDEVRNLIKGIEFDEAENIVRREIMKNNTK